MPGAAAVLCLWLGTSILVATGVIIIIEVGTVVYTRNIAYVRHI